MLPRRSRGQRDDDSHDAAASDPDRESIEAGALEVAEAIREALARRRLPAAWAPSPVLDRPLPLIESVAHELRTALTGIVGFSGLLRERLAGSSDPDVAECLDMMSSAAASASDLLENLVVAVGLAANPRMLAHREPTQLDVIDIGVVASDAVGTLMARTSAGARLTGGETLALGVDDELGLIARNLIDNAIRHGGDEIVVSVSEFGGTARLMVTDDGTGIPAAILESAFELFVAKPPHPGRAGSLGLGLAVSRALARSMGGDVRYEQVDGSSQFTLELRAAVGPAQ